MTVSLSSVFLPQTSLDIFSSLYCCLKLSFRGQFRVMRGHMNSKRFVSYNVLRWSAFFKFIMHMFQNAKFKVIKGQFRSAWGQSFDLSLVWTCFHCNTAVFSFQLICNMPIFSWFSIFQFSRSKKVTRGQIMVMRGHMVKRRKKMLSQMISLGAQLSFDIHHA